MLESQIAVANTELFTPTADSTAAYSQWRAASRQAPAWENARPAKSTATGSGGANPTLETLDDDSVRASGPNPDTATYVVELPPSTKPTTGIQLEVLSDPSFNNNGPGRADNGNFVLRHLVVKSGGTLVGLATAKADFVQGGFSDERPISALTEDGWGISGALGKPHRLVVLFDRPLEAGKSLEITLECGSHYVRHTLGRFRIARTDASAPLADLMPANLRPLLAGDAAPKAEDPLWRYFVSLDPAKKEARKSLADLQASLKTVKDAEPTALVMEEKPINGPLTAFVRHRGEFLSKEEEVSAGTPAVLPKLQKARANRLDLAKWIASPSNPLTARVQVNRMWEGLFGIGLVETNEDFGTRGSHPINPQLLDWLATEFVSRKWDMKSMMRLMVTSNTYRQSSAATPRLLEKDPSNRLLARGPRFRLDAETIRDALLASSGLLSRKTGGPSVFPYQPEGAWNNPFGDSWMPSAGEDRYRRSLYTFWKRTSPYPAYMAFDATSRETCTARRIRTNTPLQALTLLNDREMIEAANALGRRMQATKGGMLAQVAAGFRLCTGRKPQAAERDRLALLFAKLKNRYEAKPEDATKLGANSPDAAAWTMVGNVLLNLDETITKE